MRTFEQFLIENHPEILDENWRNVLRSGALAGGLLAGGLLSPYNAVGAEHRPAAVQSVGKTVTIQRNYEFDDNEEIRDTANDAFLELKAKIAKAYGQQSLSGISRPQVQIDRKTRTVTVTITVPDNVIQSKVATKSVPAKSAPVVKKQVSRSAF